MFTRTFRRRRRIRALILGLAVTATVMASAIGAAAAIPSGPPPQVDALAVFGRPAPGVSLVAETFGQSRPAPGLAAGPPVRRLFPAFENTPGSTRWNDVAVGGAIIGCLLLAGGVAILVTRRRGELVMG
jgi:hypothetical protein